MKRLLRIMMMAIVMCGCLCACNDCDCEPPYMDDPTEVAEKTKILSEYLKSHDEVNICINGERHQYNPGSANEFLYQTFQFRSADVKIDGQLIYFGTTIVLRIADFTHILSKTQDSVHIDIIFFSTK